MTDRCHDCKMPYQRCACESYAPAINRANIGIALLERAALCARDHAPLPERTDAILGQLGLIALRIVSQPPGDSAEDLEVLARVVRG